MKHALLDAYLIFCWIMLIYLIFLIREEKEDYSRLTYYINCLISKENILFVILVAIKLDDHGYCRRLIKASRKTGRDYPEFKIIERSIKKNKGTVF